MDEKEIPESEENFAEMLEQNLAAPVRLQPGQKVEAKVLKITADWVFLDIGQKGEGVLDRREITDAEGELQVREGETIGAYFLRGSGGELRFTTRVSGAAAGKSAIEDAWRSGIPVEGTLEKEIKGGYEVKLGGGVRAFCPYSQSSLRREPPEELIGRSLPFRITQYSEGGRNIVVSHRAILEEERQKQRDVLKEALREGMIVRGAVVSLQKFGAFVDIGGIEGLVPMAELAWGRVEDVREILTPGQEVEVAVKQLDWEHNRISLSLKETLADPWLQVPSRYPEGSVQTGKVVRLTPFGAFLALEPGVDGLIHISKLGRGKKIRHPREAVGEGEELQVRVERVDRESRRISLVPAEYAGTDEREKRSAPESSQAVQEEAPSMGTLGDLLKAKLREKDKKK